MRLDVIQLVFRKELREMLRDRRSLLIMFGLPLVLYPVLTLLIAGIGTGHQKELAAKQAQVAVINAAAAPHLTEEMQGEKHGLALANTADPLEALKRGQIDAILTIPPDYERNALNSEPGQLLIQLDRSRSEASFAEQKLDAVLRDYENWVIQQRLERYHVPANIIGVLPRSTSDVATGTQRLGKMLSIMLPMLLLMTGMLGALFPALNATTTERELGTLETLLVTPAGRMELLCAKGVLVFLSGLLTALLNMVSMSLVLWRTYSLILPGGEKFVLSPSALALTYLAAVPAILFFTTVVLCVGLIARNFREANSFATPVMLLPLVAVFVSIAEPPTTLGLLATPVVSTTLIIRDVLTDRATLWAFLMAFGSSSLYAGLMLSVASRLFSNEQLVNPSWEPVSLRGFTRRDRRPRCLPAVDEALALFAISLLLTLYIVPSARDWPFLTTLVGTEILLVAAPALLFAWFFRYRWRATFSLSRSPASQYVGAVLLGLGLGPIIQLLVALQNIIWQPNPEVTRQTAEMLINAVHQHPVLIPLFAGLFAGLCEELLYRGPLQVALLRKTPPWFALVLTAILFAGAHFDLHGLPLRALLGLILGWMVYRSGSIFPAMLLHATYDSSQLAFIAHDVVKRGPDVIMKEVLNPSPAFTPLFLEELGVAVVLVGAGFSLLSWSYRRRLAVSVKTS